MGRGQYPELHEGDRAGTEHAEAIAHEPQADAGQPDEAAEEREDRIEPVDLSCVIVVEQRKGPQRDSDQSGDQKDNPGGEEKRALRPSNASSCPHS